MTSNTEYTGIATPPFTFTEITEILNTENSINNKKEKEKSSSLLSNFQKTLLQKSHNSDPPNYDKINLIHIKKVIINKILIKMMIYQINIKIFKNIIIQKIRDLINKIRYPNNYQNEQYNQTEQYSQFPYNPNIQHQPNNNITPPPYYNPYYQNINPNQSLNQPSPSNENKKSKRNPLADAANYINKIKTKRNKLSSNNSTNMCYV